MSEDARTEWEKQARQRERSRQLADSVRMVNLESIEKEYRKNKILFIWLHPLNLTRQLEVG